ncbi:sugar phosphorylase [Leptolinea tardivitalis]|uniref:sugar phosphorylase n=1 Tax=Leptolinea tardivitalis TaxID=229920 RepID=UPI000785DB55|nr:sugar phosphorylase [Leptolinea tardivitalis]GAP21710.1 glycosidase [Leptolinea tardivitalis]
MGRTDFSNLLSRIYPDQTAAEVELRLNSLLDKYRGKIPVPIITRLTERDAMLITYGDQVRSPGTPHLQTLTKFCKMHLANSISSIHILPFYPWSSDDGFSVKDYGTVDPALGDWSDIDHLGRFFRLMFDAVINHASVQGDWFQAFLQNDPNFLDFFITVEGEPDLTQVIRPRTLPLLTEFQSSTGKRKVWTTFSADQADLNYANPEVLLRILDVLLTYAQHGAQFIRLDAIAYLWKEIGTSCLHQPQTHAIIQLFRKVLDDVAPHVYIITETNVPHVDNISYFGNGENEAQLVYNFALPPLVLHTLRTGDATALSNWAAGLALPSEKTTFFNFLASHDGIGLNPIRGILSNNEIDQLVQDTLQHGGLISYKNNPDGTQSPYEMNINYFDALSDPGGYEPLPFQIDRFMAAQAIMLMLRGLPGIYFHSLFGSRGWKDGVRQTGQNRSINREKLELTNLEADLTNPRSIRSQVFRRYCDLLSRRASSQAFDPYGNQEILDMGPAVFALRRSSSDGRYRTLCLQNVTAIEQEAGEFILAPYQTLWINSM